MPWPDEVLEDRSLTIARAVLRLLAESKRWRHRRVEVLTPLSGTLLRRRVSPDFTVPEELREDLRIGERFVVPLTWLARRQLVDFDLHDGGGKSASLMLGEQTATITNDVLLLAAFEGGFDVHRPDADDIFALIAEASSDTRPGDPPRLLRAAAATGLGGDFETLVGNAVRGFLMLAVPMTPSATSPCSRSARGCSSGRTSRPVVTRAHQAGRRRRPVPPAVADPHDPRVRVVVVGVAIDVATAITSQATGTAAASATVVLAAFAALSGLVLRVEAHPLPRTLLATARGWLAASGGALVLAAAPIGLQLDATTITVTWAIGIGVTFLASLVLGGVTLDHALRTQEDRQLPSVGPTTR